MKKTKRKLLEYTGVVVGNILVANSLVYLTCSLPPLPQYRMEKLHLLVLLLPVLLGFALLYICDILWLRRERTRKRWRKQGVQGPRPTLLYGNTQEMKRIRQDLAPAQKQDTNNYVYNLFPHLLLWRETYGMYLYSEVPFMYFFSLVFLC
jgi:hypothetical protein